MDNCGCYRFFGPPDLSLCHFSEDHHRVPRLKTSSNTLGTAAISIGFQKGIGFGFQTSMFYPLVMTDIAIENGHL